MEGYRGRNEIFDQGLEELNTVVRYLADFGVPAENFAVDLTIARGLDYYTGTVYETTLLDHPEIGSVCSGGRYDNLAEYYTDRQLPGAGISIGLTRLFYVLGEQGMLNPDLPTAPADVLILPMTEDLSPAIALATQLRQAGIRTQLHCEQKKFKAKMSYADKLGIPYVAFLGEDEIAQGVVKIKDMATGEQQTLSPAQAVVFRQGLSGSGDPPLLAQPGGGGAGHVRQLSGQPGVQPGAGVLRIHLERPRLHGPCLSCRISRRTIGNRLPPARRRTPRRCPPR